MDLKARVKKYASPGRSKDKATVDGKDKPKSDDEFDSDKKSIFSSSTKSPVRVFLREQLKRKGSTVGSPKSNLSGSKATTNGSRTTKLPQSKPSADDSPVHGSGAPAVPARDNSVAPSPLAETNAPKEIESPVPTESPKIQTAVAVKLEKASPQPSPGTLTPETSESSFDLKGVNGSTNPSAELMSPASFPKRLSSLQQSGKSAQPITITESPSDDEDGRRDSARDSNEISESQEEGPAIIPTTEKEEAETIPKETETKKEEQEQDAAGGIEVVLKRPGKVDEVLVMAFLILVVVFMVYNPFFDVPNIKIWGQSLGGLKKRINL